MRTDGPASRDWRHRSKWWLLLMMFLIGAQTLRLVFDVQSLNDALAVGTILGAILLALLAAGAIASRLRARRIGILTQGRPGVHCWQVSDGMLTRFLIVDETTVLLMTRRSELDRSWRRGQGRHAAVGLVANGFPSRPGLLIDFYGQAHEHLE